MPAARHNPRRRRRTASWVVAAVALVLALWALLIWALAGAGGSPEDAAAEGPQNRPVSRGVAAETGPELVHVQDEYDWDVFDERLLVGYSDNVFAGRVVEKVGSEAARTSIPNDDEDPHTQYAVEVLEVVEASGAEPVSAGGRAVVDQLGGRGERTGKLHVAAPLTCGQQVVGAPLSVGREYLFATIYDADERRYAISAPPAGAVELGGPEEREAVVAAYERAAREQVNPLRAGETKEGVSCH
jgi:hypothetical protein